MSFTLPLTNLQNVATNATATLKAPAGPGAPTYDQIRFVLGGGALPSHIDSFRAKANGRIFMDEGSGTLLNARDSYRNVFTDTANVVLDFTERGARNGATEQLLASVPGSLLQDLTFEVKLNASWPGIGTLVAYANYRPPTSNPYIRKLLNTSIAFPTAGTAAAPNIAFLPVAGAGGKIKRIWLHESVAGTTSLAQIRIANNVVFEATRLIHEGDQKRNLLVPQTGVFVLDFVTDGNLAGMLDTSNAPNVELRLVNGAACTYTIYYELIDPIGRL